ncbi:hypothetical protein HA466_0167310 [Hirschfeldia incana]|nr:hypothetical protein HA466_0167310 [Hirschfeldia incana]
MRRSRRRAGKDLMEDDLSAEEPPATTERGRRSGNEPCVREVLQAKGPDVRLPPRLFATDRYPSRRLNVYSLLEYLLIVRDELRGTAKMERLLSSCFGPLFNLHVRRCSYSSVMIHAMPCKTGCDEEEIRPSVMIHAICYDSRP